MIRHKLTLTANGQPVLTKEDASYTALRELQKALDHQLWQQVWQQILSATATVGDQGAITFSLSWECTMNGRAPARPKHVIAAEKAARAAKSQARKEREAKWQAEADQRTANLRKRIKQQVDHAFAIGKSGTEPASKYITCQHCDGPAAVVCLNQPLTRGASVLNEDTIVGALCPAHIQSTPWGYYSRYSRNNVVKVPCSKLEFFYDGIRQIAIKP